MPNIKNSQQNRPNADFPIWSIFYHIPHTHNNIELYLIPNLTIQKKKTYPPYPTATFTLPSSKKTAIFTPTTCKLYNITQANFAKM